MFSQTRLELLLPEDTIKILKSFRCLEEIRFKDIRDYQFEKEYPGDSDEEEEGYGKTKYRDI